MLSYNVKHFQFGKLGCYNESHPSYSSITDPLPTSLLLLVLATLLCLGLSLATKGIGPLCCYCCYCCYFVAAVTAVPCYSTVTHCKIFSDTIVEGEYLLVNVPFSGAIDTTVRNSLPSTDRFTHRSYHTILLLILCLQTLIFQVWLNLTNSANNTREYSFASLV